MRAMSGIRLFVEDALPGAGLVTLSADQSHYLGNVMRARIGDSVLLFNGRDGEWEASVAEIAKKAVTLSLKSRTREQSASPDLWLCFAPIKRARLDYIAEKATELGVSHIVPVMTRRTNAGRVNTDRLHANAVEAAEQCERLDVPTHTEPVKLEKLLADWPEGRRLMFCDEDLSGRSAVEALRETAGSATGPWGILIGPEGGFDDAERAMIRRMPQTVTVSLGPRILRADTASMAAVALWQAAIGDWK